MRFQFVFFILLSLFWLKAEVEADNHWRLTKDHSPFSGMDVLTIRGRIHHAYSSWYDSPAPGDSLYCVLLISPTMIAIDYPLERLPRWDESSTFQQDVVVKFKGKDRRPKLVGVFRKSFCEVFDDRNLLLMMPKDRPTIIWALFQDEFRSAQVYLQTLPKRKVGQHPMELVKDLDFEHFQFNLMGSGKAIRKLFEVANTDTTIYTSVDWR